MQATLRALTASFPPVATARQWVQRERELWQYRRIVKRHQLPLYDATTEQKLYREVASIDLFRRLQEGDDALRERVYPAGGAAGYGLLYVLARSLTEGSFGSIIEFGVGQTTSLLDGYAAKRRVNVMSVEDNAGWASRVKTSVSAPCHHLVIAQLRQYHDPVVGDYQWYDADRVMEASGEHRCSLFLIDGPAGTQRYSRVGVVPVFQRLCAEEWLVIWDDLDRSADLESFALFMDRLRPTGFRADCAFLVGMKTIGIAFTPKFEGVRYYF